MTRARDELILSPRGRLRRRPGAARLAVRARGARPAGRGRRARAPGARAATPLERLAAFEPPRAPADRAATARSTEPLSLSFYQIDDYLTCPLKYKYAHVLRVPLAPHHAIIYGAALHKAVQLFHRRQARGQVMSEDELIEAFEAAWTNEGFVTREHEEARLEAGRAALRRFRAAQLAPGRGRSRPTSSASSASRSTATGSAAAGTASTSSRPRSGTRRRGGRRGRGVEPRAPTSSRRRSACSAASG